MEDLFFRFGTFDEEITRKHRASEIPPAELFDRLLQGMEEKLGSQDMSRIRSIGLLLLDHFSLTGHLQYLNHPIRVAASLIKYLPEAGGDGGVLALVHNLFERTDGVGIPEVNALAGPTILSMVRLLNIDRTRERNSQYITKYYDDIRKAGRPICVLKALDKLDNLLEWSSRPVAPFYFEVIRSYVCSLLTEDDIRLRRYLEELESYVHASSPFLKPVDGIS
jgi:hypothetical protein